MLEEGTLHAGENSEGVDRLVQNITELWTSTPEEKVVFQEKKHSTPPGARSQGLYTAVHAQTTTKAKTHMQPSREYRPEESGILALVFIMVHTSGFSLAFFMMILHSVSMAW